MTRGTFFLITDLNLCRSIEFNGDMYPEGHGRLAKELIERVTTPNQFQRMIALFNELNHDYHDTSLVDISDVSILDSKLDFSNDYFDYWFSDWIFIKNVSKKNYTFTYRDSKEKVTVKPDDILIVTFGNKPDEKDRELLGI